MAARRLAAVIAGIGALGTMAVSSPAPALRIMENLGRGVVAVRTSETGVHVGWRLLGTDPPDLAFNLYRSAGAAAPVRLNDEPLATTTDFVDASAEFAWRSVQVRRDPSFPRNR